MAFYSSWLADSFTWESSIMMLVDDFWPFLMLPGNVDFNILGFCSCGNESVRLYSNCVIYNWLQLLAPSYVKTMCGTWSSITLSLIIMVDCSPFTSSSSVSLMAEYCIWELSMASYCILRSSISLSDSHFYLFRTSGETTQDKLLDTICSPFGISSAKFMLVSFR